ncbi:histidine phosphatase family protein [Amylibacter sp. IMCC11727]|uniref:histidine phosphatase family protein n=1 Tax=Amylibacter sp. IMCC11727 TaxID=3039851 RepID=UPI00244DBFA9|nr:histidine phosphatase family protein [Amylibacter sp. IMCC11727]WGI22244.1 histidine phosphatase family protein [Amylibacter sp. IMCC11727]
MTQLAIIRHGHTPWNRAGQIQGRTDIALEDQAAADLAKLKLPAEWEQADLVASPLLRAVETARLIADREPATVPALTEMDWGDWEGKKGIALKADPNSGFRDIEDWGWDYRPPNGESPRDVWARLAPWVATLKTDTIAVCHIGIMRVLMAQATGWDFSGPAPFQIKRNRLFVMQMQDGVLKASGDPIRLEVR